MSRLYIAYRPVTPEPPDPLADMEPETIEYLNAVSIVYGNTLYFALTAFEKTGTEIWTAVNNYVVAIKTTFSLTLGVKNLSTIFDAMWLMIGDVASMVKYNLIDPRDLDAAFRLTFTGGWTIAASGITPNGTNAYANTFWDSFNYAASNRFTFGRYMRVAATAGLQGSWDLNNPTRLLDITNTSTGSFIIGNTGGITATSPYRRFHAVVVRAASTKVCSNNSIVYNAGAITYTPVAIPFYLGARNNNNASVNQYMNGETSFAFLTGKVEISDSQILEINTAVDNLQLALNRNV